jgi:hypothetical protein
MEKRLIDFEASFIAHHQSAKVAYPSEGSFNLPPALITSQLPSVMVSPLLTVATIGGDQIDPALRLKPLPQRVTVVAFVANQSLGFRSPLIGSKVNVVQCRFQQGHFRRLGRAELTCQRNTFTIDHHHPLCTFATLGFSHSVTPFFAGAKEASAKHSSQRSWPRFSKVSRNVRQTSNQIPRSSQSASRRQHVEAEGYPRGSAFQRAPLRSTQRIPSTTGRLGIGLGPPLSEAAGSGSKGASLAHCSSVNSGCRISINRLRLIDTSLCRRRFTKPQKSPLLTSNQL